MKVDILENRYILYDDGRIYSKARKIFLKPYLNKYGYLEIVLRPTINGSTKKYRINRLIAIYFIPNPDNLPQVNHKDGNKLNNKVNNLEWCSASYNTKHSYDIGLHNVANTPKAKLT